MILSAILAAAIGGLIGSIPFGWLFTRAAGLGDIREMGSGGTGATNVLRTGRKSLAAATLLLDFLKGFIAVWLVGTTIGQGFDIIAGAAAVVGHCLPPWLGFRGGKGVATALGVFLALAWPIFVIFAVVWLAVAKTWKMSSLASLSGMGAAVVASLALTPGPVGIGILCVAAFVALRHQTNIERLIKGTEPRIGAGK